MRRIWVISYLLLHVTYLASYAKAKTSHLTSQLHSKADLHAKKHTPSHISSHVTSNTPNHSNLHKSKHLVSWSFKDTGIGFWIQGMYRPRLEFTQNKDFRPPSQEKSSKDQVHISHRARLGAGVHYKQYLHAYLELQDVRFWGSEQDTLEDFSADGLDLHRGWIRIVPVEHLSFKIGRMEISFNNHRLISSVRQSQEARAFDAVSIEYAPQHYHIRAVYASLPKKGPQNSSAHLAVAWFKWRSIRAFQPSLLYILDTDEHSEKIRHTAGVYTQGQVGNIEYNGEFFFQGGQLKKGETVQAFLAALSIQYHFPVHMHPSVKFWATWISGDQYSTHSQSEVFDTLFSAHHKFYGFMDLFLEIPEDTHERGLMDFGGRLQIHPVEHLDLSLDTHYFRLSTDLHGKHELGIEVDLIAEYSLYHSLLHLHLVTSVFIPLEASTELGKGSSAEFWGSVELSLKF